MLFPFIFQGPPFTAQAGNRADFLHLGVNQSHLFINGCFVPHFFTIVSGQQHFADTDDDLIDLGGHLVDIGQTPSGDIDLVHRIIKATDSIEADGTDDDGHGRQNEDDGKNLISNGPAKTYFALRCVKGLKKDGTQAGKYLENIAIKIVITRLKQWHLPYFYLF